MSAIIGLFHRTGAPVEPDTIHGMSQAVAHRGGSEFVMMSGQVGFATRQRSDAQKMPFAEEDGRTIACVGVLYNSVEIRDAIARETGRAVVGSLAQTLLAVYALWGLAGFARCNGAFIAAIWEESIRELVLVRDPLGLQPLVYWVGERFVAFASEPKAILRHPACSKQPDEVTIAHYLCANRYFVQDGRTFYRNIAKLRGGEALIANDQGIRVVRYWQINPHRQDSYPDDDTCVASVREMLLDSVRVRLPQSGQLGAALSGGFDSSSVVCMTDLLRRTERHDAPPLRTFSFEFGTSEADEVSLIRLVANRVGAHHEHLHALTDDLLDDLDTIISTSDGPLLDASVLLLAKKKRRAAELGVQVLLSGLGGDELFMGRINYLADLLIRARLWSLYRELRGVYPYDFSTGKRTSAKKIALAYIYAPLEPVWLTALRKRRVQRSYPHPWILPSLARRTGLLDRWPRGEGPSFPTVYAQDCYDVFHYELLTAVEYHDAVSEPFGIETRFPLLDLRLVEHLFALPRHWKLNRGRSRILQKRAMAGILPDEVLRDHLKKDFHPTLERFLVREYQKLIPAMLDSGRQRSADFIDWSVIRQKYDACMNKQEKSTPLWFALNLERWLCREF